MSNRLKEDIQSLEQRRIGTPCRSHHNSDGNPKGSGAKREINRRRRAYRQKGLTVLKELLFKKPRLHVWQYGCRPDRSR